jgi:hypothetical protein
MTGNFNADMMHGHADGHFVQTQLEAALDANAIIHRQHDKRAFGNGVATAGPDHGKRECGQATGKSRPDLDQRGRLLRALLHFLQIIATGKNPGLAGQNHHSPVLLGTIQRRIQGLEHLMAEHIGLAVTDGDCRYAIVQLVIYKICHRPFLSLEKC